jgi:hypothetical protein
MRKLTPDQILAARVEQVYREFMFMPNEPSYVVPTLWAMHTALRDGEGHFLPRTTPRLAFLSLKPGAGKSLATELTMLLSYNGEMILDPSPPSVVAMFNEDHATIGFDEIDTYFGRGSASKLRMKNIINSGYKRNGGRVTQVRGGVAERLDPFGPMVLNGKNASVWFLPDGPFDAIRSRSITIVLKPKPAEVQLARYNSEVHESRILGLREELTQWGRNNASDILSIPIEGLMPKEIANRSEEIWTVLFRIAHHLGGSWPGRVEKAARAFVLGQFGDESPMVSPQEALLNDVQAVFTDDDEFLSTAEILIRLDIADRNEELTTSLYAEWGSDRSAEMGLASVLSTVFDVQSERHMVKGVQARGYSRDAIGLDPVSVAS